MKGVTMSISKEDFVKALNRVRDDWDNGCNIHKALHNLGVDVNDNRVGLIDTYLELLARLVSEEHYLNVLGDIEFFCYELDFGRNWTTDSLTYKDGTSIDISSADKLYDFLYSEWVLARASGGTYTS
jgi:hypothetical protein